MGQLPRRYCDTQTCPGNTLCIITVREPFIFSSTDAGKILSSPTEQTKNEEENVTMQCDVELGKPAGNVTWYKGGSVVNTEANGNRFSTSDQSGTFNLTITGLNRTDEGNYSCQVQNSVRNVSSAAALLTVNCKRGCVVVWSLKATILKRCLRFSILQTMLTLYYFMNSEGRKRRSCARLGLARGPRGNCRLRFLKLSGTFAVLFNSFRNRSSTVHRRPCEHRRDR